MAFDFPVLHTPELCYRYNPKIQILLIIDVFLSTTIVFTYCWAKPINEFYPIALRVSGPIFKKIFYLIFKEDLTNDNVGSLFYMAFDCTVLHTPEIRIL